MKFQPNSRYRIESRDRRPVGASIFAVKLDMKGNVRGRHGRVASGAATLEGPICGYVSHSLNPRLAFG